MTAQGIRKTLAYKAQSAKGTAASGSGGQLLRRVTSVFSQDVNTFENDEIASHQQSTGVTIGGKMTNGTINGLLSAGTYEDLFANLLRADFAATSAMTGLSLTIAASGSNYTITRGSGSYLTSGLKAGDVIRLTAGSFAAANLNKNLLVISVGSATVCTVTPVNGSSMTAEGPIASATMTIVGKKSKPPTSSHTNVYLTFEEFYSGITRSEVYSDCKIASAEIGLPASGNATVNFTVPGLLRTSSGAQVLTTPTAETTSEVLNGTNGRLLVNGTAVTNVTGVQLTIDGGVTHGEMVVGSNYAPDLDIGRIRVSGQFTAMFDSATLQALYDAETVISLVMVVTDNDDADAEFVAFSLSAIKLTGDQPDDGEKKIVRTYPFTAQINGSGGTSLANDQTIITVQDSLA